LRGLSPLQCGSAKVLFNAFTGEVGNGTKMSGNRTNQAPASFGRKILNMGVAEILRKIMVPTLCVVLI
jgi:hypothetical protein